MTIGTEIKAFQTNYFGYFTQRTIYTGRIVAINDESITVELSQKSASFGRAGTHITPIHELVEYTYQATLADGRTVYTSAGRLYGSVVV